MQLNQPTAQGDLQAIFGGNAFNAAEVEPQGDFDVLPPCKPVSLIETAEVKQTKKGTGHYIKLQLGVLDGPHKGRKLFDQINIENPNPQCVEIGMRTLSALARAIGVMEIADTSQLVNQVVVPHVIVKNDEVYGQKNVIRTYSSPNEAQPQTGDAGLPTPAAAAVAPQAAGPAPASLTGPAVPGGTPVHKAYQSPPTGQRPWDRKAA